MSLGDLAGTLNERDSTGMKRWVRVAMVIVILLGWASSLAGVVAMAVQDRSNAFHRIGALEICNEKQDAKIDEHERQLRANKELLINIDANIEWIKQAIKER